MLARNLNISVSRDLLSDKLHYRLDLAFLDFLRSKPELRRGQMLAPQWPRTGCIADLRHLKQIPEVRLGSIRKANVS